MIHPVCSEIYIHYDLINMFLEPYPVIDNRAPFGSLDMDYRCEHLQFSRPHQKVLDYL